MSRFFLMILEKYGLGVLNLSLLIFVSWKLFTNHLKHISNTLKENGNKLENLDNKVDKLGERISKVEGIVS